MKAIEFVNKIYDEGYDLDVFNKEVIDYLRKLLLLKISPSLGNILEKEATEEEMSTLFKQAQNWETNTLERLLRKLVEVQWQLKTSPVPTLPLELFLSEELI